MNVPKYRLHRPSGLGVVTLNGKDHYLGKHNSKASKKQYQTVAIPTYVNWFANNFTNIVRDVGVGYVTIWKNAFLAWKDMFVEVWNFIRSGLKGGFSELAGRIGEIAGRSMLDGFEAQTEPLPEVAARQIAEYEKQLEKDLQATMAKSAGILAQSFNDELGRTANQHVTLETPDVPTASDLAASLPSLARRSFESVGSFSVANLNRSLPGTRTDERIEKNTKLSHEEPKKIRDLLPSLIPRFG